jgi:uncharacterized membrane protein YdjX (TVP38/TMEM64 family)
MPGAGGKPAARFIPRIILVLVVLAAAVVAGVLGGREAAAWIPAFVGWVERAGPAAPVVFVAGYAAGTVLLVPGSIMTLAAGAVFGVVHGTLLVAVGATGGMVLAFGLSRRLTRRLVERRLAGSPRLAALDGAVSEDGWRVVLLLRLSPLIPFSILNYLLGLTRVRFRDFLAGSIGILPWTAVYAWAGALAGDLAAISVGAIRPPSGLRVAMVAVGAVATVGLVVVLTRRARQALARVAPDLAA